MHHITWGQRIARRLTAGMAAMLLLVAHQLADAQGVIISEFMAANAATLQDEDGDYEDWIELHNSGASPVDLTGWALTDDSAEPQKWLLPALTLQAGQYRVIFASNKDRRNPASELHANFKLSSDGEYLALIMADGVTVADEYAPAFPPQDDDVSYGRVGDAEGFFTSPTPGAANGELLIDVVADTHFSIDRGFYSSPFNLILECDTPQAEIRYTLDGTPPTETTGMVYQDPIPISQTTIVRAAAYRPGWVPSDVDTATYLFPESVFTQPEVPAGFPETWGGGVSSNDLMDGDYEMDPQVTEDPDYSSQLEEALLSLPAVSIAMPIDDLFDDEVGIYSNGAREGDGWERACSTELILPSGEPGFSVRAGIQIQGGSSTQPNWKSPKLSMRIVYKDQYGPAKLRYPLFSDSEADEFDTLILDARLNMTWIHQSDQYQREHAQYARDAYMNDLQLATGNLSPHSRYVHLFLNGVYWGMYCLHERPDDNFLESYFGGSSDEYDVMRHQIENVVAGSSADAATMFSVARGGLSSDANYEQFATQWLDIPAFIDYMLINQYAGNTDWPHQNWYLGRNRTDGSLFRYYSWDAEHVLKDPSTDVTDRDNSNSPGELLDRLSRNDEFAMAYADRAHQLLFNSGLLTPHYARSLYEQRIDEIDPAIILESARWGDHRRDHHPLNPPSQLDLYTRNDYWLPELERLRNQYFPQRTNRVISQLRNRGLYPDVDAPQVRLNDAPSTGGAAQIGDAVSLVNPNGSGTIYYGLDGIDPRPAGGAASPAPGAAAYSQPLTVDRILRIRSRVLSGSEWSAAQDTVFTLQAPTTSTLPLRIDQIHYHPPDLVDGGNPDAEFIKLIHTGSEDLQLEGVAFTSGVDFIFPAYTLTPRSAVYVVFDRDVFVAEHGEHPNVAGEFTSGRLDNDGERIVLVDGLGSVIHDFSYDDAWHPLTDGDGPALEIIDPFDPDRSHWALGAFWRAATPAIYQARARGWQSY